MPERIEWLQDGTPYSPRFGDRYRSELGGLDQAREVFLKGCGLPAAWAQQPQWRILETGFGLGLNFLVTWAAWKADPQRPRLLHFVSTEAFPASAADVLRSAASHPELLPLAEQLQAQLWGLLPGFHRLVFEGGQVLLSLCIGDAKAMLREQQFEADAVYLDGFSPQRNPELWDVQTFKAVARCCRRGTRVATWTVARSVRDALAQCGFVVQKTPGIPPKRDNLQGEYNPRWEPRKAADTPLFAQQAPGSCVVIGGGLAGAATAASLARRGWRVEVLDAASTPASGASGLPAGLFAPQLSPDDNVLSRLSRSGVRATLPQASALLREGLDWQATGVLEHRLNGKLGLPADWPEAGRDWSCEATPEQRQSAGFPGDSADTTPACWHRRAGWIKASQLAKALLAHPAISWRAGVDVAQILPRPSDAQEQGPRWQLLDATGQTLAQADLVVVAAAYASRELLGCQLPLQAIRGQMSWGWREANEAADAPAFPALPVNGHGSFIPRLPMDQGHAWLVGATFERDKDKAQTRPEDHLANFARLQTLLPATAAHLAAQFSAGKVKAWAGVRCASPDRLPLLGPVPGAAAPGLWVCTAMGSRGLTFALLCAELLAARLHGEPLPVEKRLAQAMDVQRFFAADT
ncbi:FAD-dependent 5-carboxymethylaminomethyl-2-thiouridine(34) oxidoreductase MnmC [Polaromonas sp.]|uniref:FAD-dependent 5-carboxymethylaminomethyl-2-thiouridine(34) oxidoreductase MnmC n=1 Tax=Polaromonas sp. TaxID=1869339 RepID=UPI002FC8260F